MTLRTWALTAATCFSLLTVCSGLASAQDVTDSFSELGSRVKLGSTLFVSDGEGHPIKGKLTNITASSVSLKVGRHEQTFAVDRIRQITEQRRYTSRGATIGFLAGAGLVLLSEALTDDDACSGYNADICSTGFTAEMAVVMGGLFAGVGAGIGAGITHERLVYRAPTTAPSRSVALAALGSKPGIGVRMSYRF
jgi:hypothetical protein